MSRLIELIKSPYLVLFWCFVFIGVHLFVSESWFKIWVQYRDLEKIEGQLISLHKNNNQMLDNLKHGQDLYNIEMQAKDRLGLLRGNEYVFLFSPTSGE